LSYAIYLSIKFIKIFKDGLSLISETRKMSCCRHVSNQISLVYC